MYKPKFIIFDCWGTLISYSIKDPYHLSEHLLKYCDNPMNHTKEEIQNFIGDFFQQYYTNENQFEVSINQILKYICLNLDLYPRIRISTLVKLTYGTQYNPKPVEKIKEFLSFLDKNEIEYAVLSNTVFDSKFTQRYIEKVLKVKSFKFILASSDVAVKKPSEKFFLTGCKYASMSPSDCMYIGDNFYADVYGSYNAGFYDSVWINLDNKEIPFDKHLEIPKDIQFINAHSYDDVIEYLKNAGYKNE